MSSSPSEQAALDLGVDLEGRPATVPAHLRHIEVDRRVPGGHHRADVVLGQHHRQEPDLRAVGIEDVREARRDDRLEAIVLERPRRVLAR